MVEKYILDNKGTKEDGRDIFQDAIYILIKKLSKPNFELSSKLSTFLFGIAKNLWLRKLTAKGLDAAAYSAELNTGHLSEDEQDQLFKVKKMKVALEKLGEPCRGILTEFYYNQSSMKEIAELYHYSNPEHAKNQKYKCLMRLKKLMGK